MAGACIAFSVTHTAISTLLDHPEVSQGISGPVCLPLLRFFRLSLVCPWPFVKPAKEAFWVSERVKYMFKICSAVRGLINAAVKSTKVQTSPPNTSHNRQIACRLGVKVHHAAQLAVVSSTKSGT